MSTAIAQQNRDSEPEKINTEPRVGETAIKSSRAHLDKPLVEAQLAKSVLMVPPTAFRRTVATDESEDFLHDLGELDDSQINAMAMVQFMNAVKIVKSLGVEVVVIENPDKEAPAAVFPNNWVTTHDETDGEGVRTFITYPMHSPERRREQVEPILRMLRQRYDRWIDLSFYQYEEFPMFLEGTGALVLDRAHKVAYATLSDRTHGTLVRKWAHMMKYQLIVFLTSEHHKSVYHTNVCLTIGAKFAIICSEVVLNQQELSFVMTNLRKYHDVIEVTKKQMLEFCCNCVELRNEKNETFLLLSTTAHRAFTEEQLARLEKYVTKIVPIDVEIFEDEAGGSLRCMLGELF